MAGQWGGQGLKDWGLAGCTVPTKDLLLPSGKYPHCQRDTAEHGQGSAESALERSNHVVGEAGMVKFFMERG